MARDDPTRPLRSGWTTGTCATAAAAAAYEALLTGTFPADVTVALPRGQRCTLALARGLFSTDGATAGVIKDAGDDPDVTHGAEVQVTVAPTTPGSGVSFAAGPGVGTITRPGLALPPGEPAINPTPRAMIREAIADMAERFGGSGDVRVTISIPGGEDLAARTLNGRLGIEGGLSILGTSGIVVPFSCAAWIHSIHRGIDVARALRLDHLAGSTGRTSEAAVQAHHRLPEAALIDMGDFIGGTLKYLRSHPVSRFTIAGGFAKIVKLAQGHRYVHSSKSRVDHGRLAASLAATGAPAAAVEAARSANTAAEVLDLAGPLAASLAQCIARDALGVAMATVADRIAVDVLIVDRAGSVIAATGHHDR